MPTYSVDQLKTLFEGLADHFGMDEEEKSAWVEQTLVAELRGNIMQSLAYFEHHNAFRLTNGVTVLGAKPDIVKETPAMAILDAKGGLGPMVARRAMELACRKAKEVGAATVAVRNSTDFNMVSYCTLQAPKFDCVGSVLCNSYPEIAPWGATSAVYGMNPFSYCIPAGHHYPILVDMCSSASGGIEAFQHLVIGERMPDNVSYFDKSGKRITDVSAWGKVAGWGLTGIGAQRMSGYRDMALTVVTDSLGGALTGMKCAMDLGVEETAVNSPRVPRGQLVTAYYIDHFTPINEFKAKMDRAIDQAKASPLEDGASEILMPGERGFREEARRRRDGIPILEKVWKRLRHVMLQRGLDVDEIAGRPLRADP